MTHDALFFSTDDELVAGTHGLIEQGLLAGDLVLVLGNRHELGVLAEAWDDDPRITFQPMGRLHRAPMAAIAEFQRLLHRETSAGRTVRATGTASLEDLDPLSEFDWRRYEALLSRAFAPYDYQALCRYDTRTAHPELLAHARATHDRIVTPAGVEAGDERREQVLADLRRVNGETAHLEHEPPVVRSVLTSTQQLRELREALQEAPHELLLAINEVAANALVHGGPPVTVSVHQGAAGWLGIVSDHGLGIADPFVGVDSPLPRPFSDGGRGLWMAQQLCDHLFITTGPDGGTTAHLVQRTSTSPIG